MSYLKPKNILITADHPSHIKKTKHDITHSLPHTNITCAISLSEGVSLLSEQKFDVVFLDLLLPESINESTIQEIVKHCPKTPIVIISSPNDTDMIPHSVSAGAQDYLSRGKLNQDTVTRSICHATEHKRLELKSTQSKETVETNNSNLEKIIGQQTRELAHLEEQYRTLVHLAPLGIIKFDKNYNITFANLEFQSLFGYEVNETTQLTLNELVFQKDLNKLKGSIEKVLKATEKPTREILRLVRKDGKEYWHHITISISRDKNKSFQHFVCIIDNMTEKNKKESLEQEIKITEEASQAKTDFLTNVSHEIRTPLAAITGFVDLALEATDKKHINNSLEIIKRNSKVLLSLVNNLLDLSNIEAGQLDISHAHFSLVDEVNNVLSIVRSAASEKGLSVNVDYAGQIPESIYTDSHKLKQILVNLIKNAIKYTDKGEINVLISVKHDPKTSTYALNVDVMDTGVGIDPGMLNRIFQPFSRGKSQRVLKKDGIGVGLALSRNLAIKLGGDISLINTSDLGTKFSLTLNLGGLSKINFFTAANITEKQLEKQSSFLTQEKPLSGYSLLVAEDAEDLQVLIAYYLKKHGAHVDICSDGVSAVEMALREDYDCILLDIQMPRLHGDAATIELRKRGYQGKIIALTAHAFQEERSQCLKIGFDAFLTKPVHEKELISTVRRFCRPESKYSIDDSISTYAKDPIIRKAADIFLGNLIQNIDTLRDGVSHEKWDCVAKIAHKIKGSSSSHGYPKMSEISKALEDVAKTSHRKETAYPLIDGLHELSLKAIDTLHH